MLTIKVCSVFDRFQGIVTLRLQREIPAIMYVSLSSTLLLSVSHLITSQLLSTMLAAPIECKNKMRESGKSIAKNCAELYRSGQTISGVYTIDPDGSGAFDVYCDQTSAGGGWTVLQKRLVDTIDFNRTWDDYKNGFGDFLIREFWLGLDKIQRLAPNKTENKLRVDLGVNASKTVHAEYESFGIENETAVYKLHIGSISTATVKDSLTRHDGFSFGTWDRHPAVPNCAELGGGWWYENSTCAVSSNLNGIYPQHGTRRNIYWAFLSQRADGATPTTSEIKIRPADFF